MQGFSRSLTPVARLSPFGVYSCQSWFLQGSCTQQIFSICEHSQKGRQAVVNKWSLSYRSKETRRGTNNSAQSKKDQRVRGCAKAITIVKCTCYGGWHQATYNKWPEFLLSLTLSLPHSCWCSYPGKQLHLRAVLKSSLDAKGYCLGTKLLCSRNQR